MAQPAIFEPMHFSYDVVDAGRCPRLIENLFQLYKIHGSIDWELNGRLNRRQEGKDREASPHLSRNTKYELAFAQYTKMISSFQPRCASDTAFDRGFGLTIIRQPILAAIETNLSLKVVVIAVSSISAVIPDIAAQTDLERHLDRVRAVRER